MSQRDNFNSRNAKSSVLSNKIKKHLEEEWKPLMNQNQLFPMSIPSGKKCKVKGEICPRPFPKLSNMFGEEATDNGRESDQRTNSSSLLINEGHTVTNISANFGGPNNNTKKNSSNIANSFTVSTKSYLPTAAKSKSDISRSRTYKTSLPRPNRPGSAPTFTSCRKNANTSSPQRNLTDGQQHYDNLRNNNVFLPQKSPITNATGVIPPRGEGAAGPYSPNTLLNSTKSLHRISLPTKDSSDSFANIIESRSDLMTKGIELLTTGKDIIEKSRHQGRFQAQSLQEVADRLQEIVTGELTLLKEENESLKAANVLLNEQMLTVANNAETCRLLRHQSVARGDGNEQPNVLNSHNGILEEEDNPKYIQHPSASTEMIRRITVLEDNVTCLHKYNATQTSRFQERLYEQELRYEETLGKFEDVIAHLTNMFTALQASYYNAQTQNKNLNASSGIVKEATEVLADITKSTQKKVQFKGILKR